MPRKPNGSRWSAVSTAAISPSSASGGSGRGSAFGFGATATLADFGTAVSPPVAAFCRALLPSVPVDVARGADAVVAGGFVDARELGRDAFCGGFSGMDALVPDVGETGPLARGSLAMGFVSLGAAGMGLVSLGAAGMGLAASDCAAGAAAGADTLEAELSAGLVTGAVFAGSSRFC